MEPEIIALARRMYEAAERRAYADEGRRPRVLSWEMIRVGEEPGGWMNGRRVKL